MSDSEKLNKHELWRLRELVLAERYVDESLSLEKKLEPSYRKELRELERKLVRMRYDAMAER